MAQFDGKGSTNRTLLILLILVDGIPTPLKNMKVSWGYYSQYMERHKIHVPKHQPKSVETSGKRRSTIPYRIVAIQNMSDSNAHRKQGSWSCWS